MAILVFVLHTATTLIALKNNNKYISKLIWVAALSMIQYEALIEGMIKNRVLITETQTA